MTQTTELFWDCECEDAYIHPKFIRKCKKCATWAIDQPDSHIQEVMDYLEERWMKIDKEE